MIRNRLKTQEFNDGIVKIYPVVNSAAAGNTPKESLGELLEVLRFKRRTVGVERYETAKQNHVLIEQLVRCQWRDAVSPQHVAVIGAKQYRIEQVQYPEDIYPRVMDLSLSRLEADYEIP